MPRIFFVKSTERKEFRLETGTDDKITFGPAIPFPARQEARFTNPRSSPLTYALRVYAKDGKTLRAVFPGVYEIRELGVGVTPVMPEVEEFPAMRDDEPTAEQAEAAAAAGRVFGFGTVTTKAEGDPVQLELQFDTPEPPGYGQGR